MTSSTARAKSYKPFFAVMDNWSKLECSLHYHSLIFASTFRAYLSGALVRVWINGKPSDKCSNNKLECSLHTLFYYSPIFASTFRAYLSGPLVRVWINGKSTDKCSNSKLERSSSAHISTSLIFSNTLKALRWSHTKCSTLEIQKTA